jgi:hypothetical protein
VNNVGLKICLLGTSNFMVTLAFFFLGVNEVVMGQVQHPITYFTGIWDNFMVMMLIAPKVTYDVGLIGHSS